MPIWTWLPLIGLPLAGLLLYGLRRARQGRWERVGDATEAAASPAPAPAAPTPGDERVARSTFELSAAMARAVAWADAREAEGKARWLDAHCGANPEDLVRLFEVVRALAPEAFGGDRLALISGFQVGLVVKGLRWVVDLPPRDGWLDDAFWTFLNRVLEARGSPLRLATPRLATWRFPVVVTTLEDLHALREQGMGFLSATPPLYPRRVGDDLRLSPRPFPDPKAFRRDLGKALEIEESRAAELLERLGRVLAQHLRKFGLVQLPGFGDFRVLAGGGADGPLVRFRAHRDLRRAVENPVFRQPVGLPQRLAGAEPEQVTALLATLGQTLGLGCGAASVPGFGTFWRELQPGSILRHPQNQQPVWIPARRDVAFEMEQGALE